MTWPLMHPDATWRPFNASGKAWRGGTGRPKLVLHTMECVCWPRYNSGYTAPHLDFAPSTGELRQHITFDKSAYSLRENDLEDDRYTYQVEMQGRAAQTRDWPDAYYRRLADLIRWFHDNLDVPLVFADFSVMKAGTNAPQRMSDQAVRDFAGVMGHGHFGRDVDSHWDPGRLWVAKIEHYLGLEPSQPVPDPITIPGVDMLYPFYKTDGYDKPTAPGRTGKRDDVLWLQRRINTLLDDPIVEDGLLGPTTLSTFHNLIGSDENLTMITGAEGADFDHLYTLATRAEAPGDHRHATPAGETGGVL